MSTAAPTLEPPAADLRDDAPVGNVPDAEPGPLARIRSIEIENLRGVRRGRLDDLAPLTVLTGPNGSGKSTVLDALDIGGSPNPAEAVRDCVLRRPKVPHGGRWLFPGGVEDRTEPRVRCETAPGEMRRVRLVAVEPGPAAVFSVRVFTDRRPASGSPTAAADGIAAAGRVDFVERGRPKPEGASSPSAGVREVTSLQGLPTGSLPGRSSDELLSEVRRRGLRDRSDRVARNLFPGVERLELLSERGRPYMVLDYGDRVVPVALGGDGAYAALRLALELLILADGVALLEEPEAHLHPAAMRLVARAIVDAVRGGTQVVLTTHSVEFLDCLLDEAGEEAEELLALFMVNLRGGDLVNARFDGDEVRFSREQIVEDLR